MDKTALVVALRDVFRARGWDGASLADLAVATGLSRATLYHHFRNGKADMAAAALADVEARLEARILAPLRGAGPPAAKLQAFVKTVDAYYRGGELGCLLAALSAQHDHGLGDRVASAFTSWTAALRDLALEAGVDKVRAPGNALAVVIAIQGALVLSRAMASTTPFQIMVDRLPDLLFGLQPLRPPPHES